MNVLSLFDGMSCGQIALNKLGIKCDNYYASEIDKYAIKVTMKNYPNTKQLGDVTKIKGEDLPKIDLLIGGSPCQNFSFCGNRKGMSTTDNIEILTLKHYNQLKNDGFVFIGQSYLFWDFIRLLKETKPKYFLLENVVMGKKWEILITETIGVSPIRIPSSLISAQNRDRLYWSNIKQSRNLEDKNIILKDILDVVSNEKIYTKPYYKEVTGKKYLGYVGNSPKQATKVYGIDGKSQCLMANGGGQGGKTGLYVTPEGVRKLNVTECERLQTVPVGYTKVKGISNTQRYKMLGNGWTVDVICHIFKNLLNKKKG